MTKISVTVECNTPQEAQAVINSLSSGSGAGAASPAAPAYTPPPVPAANFTPPPPVATVPPPAPATPSAPAGVSAPPPGAPVAPAAPPTPAAPPATSGDVSKELAVAAQSYAKTYGPKAAKAILTQLNVTGINQITDPAQQQWALNAFRSAPAAA